MPETNCVQELLLCLSCFSNIPLCFHPFAEILPHGRAERDLDVLDFGELYQVVYV